MRLRRVTALIIAATTVALVGVLYVAARTILLGGFREAERFETVQNVQRARDALGESLTAMSTKVSDWASWDDTCRFIVDRNQAFIDSNLTAASIENLDINAIVFFDVHEQLVQATCVGTIVGEGQTLAPGIEDLLRTAGLTRHENEADFRSGLLVVPRTNQDAGADSPVLLVASRPILTSENEGPSRGSVVFIRVLDSAFVAELAARTHIHLSVHNPATAALPEDCRQAITQLITQPIVTIPRSADVVTGYTLLSDANGSPVLLLRIESPRVVYRQGLIGLRWLISSIMLAGGVIGLATMVLMNRVVTRRLERMTSLVEQMSADPDAAPLPETGVRELRSLSASINRMVREITHARDELSTQASELRSKGEQLDHARHAAEAASRAKSEFLAHMSHELRTPMTAVLGYADLLLDADVEEPTRSQYLQRIHAGGHSLLSIINDILDISKIEAGQMTVERLLVSPAAIVAEVDSLLRARAENKGIRLNVACATAIPVRVLTDPVRLRQILINIVGNAVKFTNAGSVTVSIRLEPLADGGRDRLCFEVTDTGVGISPHELSGLFQPFFQADSSTSRRFGGTGLGLCISRRLARALGGDITVQSTVGRGSSFCISIDPGHLEDVEMTTKLILEPAAFDTGAHGASADSLTTLAARILLAEDSPENQRLIAHVLRKAGAEVDTADNGERAVSLAIAAHRLARPYDVILLDMQMPIMDGYTAAACLREAGYRRPIIALTAFSLAGEREKCVAAGCDDYAAKPIDRTGLIRMCAQWASRATEQDVQTSGARR